MKLSICGSLQAFIVARPPVVAFAFSLVAITLTIFLVALYIKDKNLILDPHTPEDWNSLKHHLANQKFCIKQPYLNQSSETSKPLPSLLETLKNGTMLPAVVNNLNINLWSSHPASEISRSTFFVLTKHISVKGWERSCRFKEKFPSDDGEPLTLTIIVPPAHLSENSLPCVFLSGPSNFHWLTTSNTTETLLRNQCQVSNEKRVIYLTPIEYESGMNSICSINNTVEISYDHSGFVPKTYLTEKDKVQIFSNLIFVDVILVVLILMLLLYAILKGRELSHTSRHTLLSTKETSDPDYY